MSACRDERRKAVEKLYKMRLTWGNIYTDRKGPNTSLCGEKVQNILCLKAKKNKINILPENTKYDNSALTWQSVSTTVGIHHYFIL